MLNGKPVLAVIPARGGSKGIPGKNLRRLGRDTLLERAIKLGKACQRIDKIIVTTDDPEMHALAQRYDVAAPSLRPAHLADDRARTADAVLHVMDQIQGADGYILLLQPTSPFRTLADLNSLLDNFANSVDRADAIVSLSLQDDPHPNKLQAIKDDYVTPYLKDGDGNVPRQALPPVYALNGAFYMLNSDVLRKEKTFLPKRTLPFIMPCERSINLDNMMDWYLAETLVERKLVPFEEYGDT